MDIPGDRDESDEENLSGAEADVECDPANVCGSDSDYPEESVKEVKEASTSRDRR